MEKLAAMMAFCEAPLDGTVAPSGAAVYGAASATGGSGNVVALLDAATKKLPMEKLVSTMAFCEAPLDGTFDGTTSAPSSGAAGNSASALTAAGGGGNVLALLAAAAKKYPVGRLVSTMAFCEAPLDGTFDGTTSAPSSGAAGGDCASDTNVPGGEAGGGGEDAAALRRAWLAEAKKEWPLREHRLLREKAGTVVDGLAIFETVALE